MGIAKPTGGHADQMLDAGGWPDVDENAFYDRAQEYTRVLRQVTEVLETCQHQQGEIFEGGIWSGSAASAANGELGTNIGELVTLQNGLATVITWQQYIGGSIVQAKSDISDNVEAAQTQIDALEMQPGLEAAERATAINTVISAAHGANLSVMAGTAERIRASKAWKPPSNALKDLLDQKIPPPVAIPDTPAPVTPPPVEREPRPTPTQPAPVMPAPVMPSRPTQPSPGAPAPVVPQPNPGVPATPVSPGGAPAAPPRPPAPAVPLSPAASAGPLGPDGRGKGVAPASTSGSSPSVPPPSEDSSAAVAPAAAGTSAMPMTAGGSPGGGTGAGSGSSRSGSGAPVGQKPSGTSPSTRPAAARSRAGANRMAARNEPTAAAVSSDDGDLADAVAVEPIIPVSPARAQRDAIAEAATAEAVKRRGTDPLATARRVAAALNAPDSAGAGDFGFFWVTAVTADGAIVVANSYGLAYIPDGVQLPDSVHMATADEAIPAAERARWATYPIAAVQGWADHRDSKLRAVIATEEQFADSDPGATKVVLKPDDIPVSGAMVGRSRLEVVDPEAAERLASTPDVRLVGLVPAAPAGTSGHADKLSGAAVPDSDAAAPAEPSSPDDRRPVLWLDVMSPMFSSAAGRDVAHLRAFHSYATHTQEVLLVEAHAAVEPVAQRSAVGDWLYWKHLNELLGAALAPTS